MNGYLLKKLERISSLIEDLLKDAEINENTVGEAFKLWLHSFEELVYETDSLLSDVGEKAWVLVYDKFNAIQISNAIFQRVSGEFKVFSNQDILQEGAFADKLLGKMTSGTLQMMSRNAFKDALLNWCLGSLKKLFVEGMPKVVTIAPELFPSLKVLELEDMHVDCSKLDDVLIGKMSSLRVILRMERSSKAVLTSIFGASSSIISLKMDNISGLTPLHGEVLQHMGVVEHLCITKCHIVEYLWELKSEARKYLGNLKKLEASYCKKLASLGKTTYNIGIATINLTEVSHTNCEMLQSYKCPQSIKKLVIHNCQSIEELLFPQGQNPLLILDIQRCHSLKALDDKGKYRQMLSQDGIYVITTPDYQFGKTFETHYSNQPQIRYERISSELKKLERISSLIEDLLKDAEINENTVEKVMRRQLIEESYASITSKKKKLKFFNDEKVKDHFEFKAWVPVYDKFDAIQISNAIFQCVSREFKEFSNQDMLQEGALADNILRKMTSGTLQTMSRNASKDALLNWQSLSLLAIDALGEQNIDSHLTFWLLAERICEKCQGLPLALESVRKLLKTKTGVKDWEMMLHHFSFVSQQFGSYSKFKELEGARRLLTFIAIATDVIAEVSMLDIVFTLVN
ncbi:putative disease resistance RPP13-like protein 1, partial [Tanacetum coccineum]